MGETKRREIRVGDDLWNAAIAKAHAEGVTLSELVRNWMTDYIYDDQTVRTELKRIIRRLAEIHKRVSENDMVERDGYVWPESRNGDTK